MASRSGPVITPRGGSGNATVPGDAPIQPPQAYVDISVALINGGFDFNNTAQLPNRGITQCEAYLEDIFNAVGALPSTDISGNALTDTNAILAFYAAHATSILSDPILNLSNQTPPAPPPLDGAGVASAGTAEQNAGYTVRGTNSGKPYYNRLGNASDPNQLSIVWSGISWDIKNSSNQIAYTSTDDVAFPWLATFTSVVGSDPAPTVTNVNCEKFTLTAAGWTVTTD